MVHGVLVSFGIVFVFLFESQFEFEVHPQPDQADGEDHIMVRDSVVVADFLKADAIGQQQHAERADRRTARDNEAETK